ncbi:hypothetical protein OEG88_14165 (plasmid) [Clostridium perfringens]|jgi:hypothetical protein|uniref:hypothetical protein n=1 Tax=Clostridia TaxID=186801 RepID=UPI001A30CAA9|nr:MULTISPECIES: hypothetical protein [Clostridiaceae]EJT5915415.1 hypothetical protein [Clostridium perfringens]EJT6615252.1 hypothetical protein [Clostridium perfringens]MBS5954907.1 hypothetical protein [Paraclostridium bifermentans]UYC94386.1 hypothetical protein OEG88_14165 [Clostridium perfringens]HAT4186718.1 hypothetical protein [Clostridium perfringens]
MSKILKKVTLTHNIKKKIYFVSFKNEMTNNERKTKSVGSDENKALKSKENIEKMINEENCDTYEAYKEALKKYPMDDVRVVYGGTKYEILFTESLLKKFYDSQISLYKKVDDDIEYLADVCMLIGTTGVGKTKLLQQLIGSEAYNTPASTISNTTTGTTNVYIARYSKCLELVYEEINNAKLYEKIKKNICETIREIMKNGDEKQLESVVNNLLVSSDLRCNLSYLISNKTEIEKIAKELLEKVPKNLNNIICLLEEKLKFEISSEERLALIDDIIFCISGEEFYDWHFNIGAELTKTINSLFNINHYIKDIYSIVKSDKNKILKGILKEIKKAVDDIKGINITISLLKDSIIKNYDKLELEKMMIELNYGDNLSYNDEFDNINSMYIKIKYSNDTDIDDKLRDRFFKIMQRVSCVNSEIKSLFPLVEALTIKGSFKSSIPLDNKSDVILVDSEGFGHDAAKMEINNEFIKNIKISKKILWLVASDRPISSIEKETLELLANNGVLYKTCAVITKADTILDKNEMIENRINSILSNLFKEFNSNSLIINSKESILSKLLVIGDIDKKIVEEKVIIPYRGRIIEDNLDERFRDNFKKLLDFKEFKFVEDIKFDYSLIDFANNFDEEIIKFLNNYKSKIAITHWAKVKAATDRIGYNYNNRSYDNIAPEADLKRALKSSLFKVIYNPSNLKKSEIENNFDTLQCIQESISLEIDKLVEKYIWGEISSDNDKNEVKAGAKWRKIYRYHGEGSGNRRKYEFNVILKDAVGFDRSRNKENKILRDIFYYIDNNIPKVLNSKVHVKIKSIL